MIYISTASSGSDEMLGFHREVTKVLWIFFSKAATKVLWKSAIFLYQKLISKRKTVLMDIVRIDKKKGNSDYGQWKFRTRCHNKVNSNLSSYIIFFVMIAYPYSLKSVPTLPRANIKTMKKQCSR